MNKKYFFTSIFLSAGIIVLSLIINYAAAQSEIQYPVKELGNCADEAACRTYCDKPENIKACIGFAEKNNLMSAEELQRAKKFMAAGAEGPGGCTGRDSCEEYCNDISHIDECISFAEENNLIPPEELEEAKKVQAAIRRGIMPPPCGNKRACDVYCSASEHMEECIAFGIEAGFIQGQELEDVQKMLAAIKRGVQPPPCQGKKACDEYCSQPDNMEVCMNFAMEAGFMSEEEKEGAQKMLQALKKGIKPPACKGKEECDVYCGEESHFEECTKFAEAAGFMSPEEAEMARKTGGKSPGGCKGKEECEAFCNNPANQETCFNFAKEHGLIPEEELQKMEEGKQKFRESLSNMPPPVSECLNSAVGSEMMEKFKSGALMPPKEIGDRMRECFESYRPEGPGAENSAPGEGGSMPPGAEGSRNIVPGTTGPGGCASPEECQEYCESNPEACGNFQPQNQPNMSDGAPIPGSNFMPCEGENCLPPPSMPGGGPGSVPCQGENCPSAPPPGSEQYQTQQPGQAPVGDTQPMPSSGGEPAQPPPPGSTAPGSGGEMQPGVYVAPIEVAPQIEQSEPAPSIEPAPSSFNSNSPSLLGAVLTPFTEFLFGK